jgi:amino acid transporter
VIFAAAFDRVLPERVASVEPRSRAPIWATVLMVVPGLIVSYLYIYNTPVFGTGFASVTLASTLVIAITYLGSTIAAILLPFVKKDLYNASPIAKYKVAGLPLISVAGVIFGAFLVFLLYQWFLDPNALYGIGLKNTASVTFMGVMYGLAIVIYVVAKIVRRGQGVDLGMVYKEIPAE